MTMPTAIDWTMCLEKAMDKEDLAIEMLDRIVASLPGEQASCRAAYNNNKLPALQHAVHKLNGVCLYSGLPALQEAGKNLELALREGTPPDIADLFERFEEAIAGVIAAYQANQYR